MDHEDVVLMADVAGKVMEGLVLGKMCHPHLGYFSVRIGVTQYTRSRQKPPLSRQTQTHSLSPCCFFKGYPIHTVTSVLELIQIFHWSPVSIFTEYSSAIS